MSRPPYEHCDTAMRNRRTAALARMRTMVTEGRIDFAVIGYPEPAEQPTPGGQADRQE
ncbi:hypothetical protein ACFU6K_05770 [Kitasatospora sp. NPDC057512]|uniref:hypothetical protein n=1 Tax=Kitasatospora sp. NPDC057512 TaxID=3346154 RepID=UPI0036B243DE